MAKGSTPVALRWVPYLTMFGRRIEAHLSVSLLRFAVVALGFLALWCVLPRPLMERGGVVFDPLFVTFVSTVVGGSVCHFFRLPALVGVLLVAMIMGNIADGYFTEGIVSGVRFVSTRIGLTVIVSRSGFAVNLSEVKKMWKNVLALSLIPMVMEAVVHAVVAKEIIGFPDYRWAFIQGFCVSGIAPGVVVPPLLGLRAEGFGHTGPTNLMLSSVVLDSVGSIWATSFFIDLVFSDLPVWLSVALGPIQLIGGLILGALAALTLHCITKVFLTEVAPIQTGQHNVYEYPKAHERDMHHKVVILYTVLAVALVFLGERFAVAGGGAIGALSLAATLAHLWAVKAVPAASQRCETLDMEVMTKANTISVPDPAGASAPTPGTQSVEWGEGQKACEGAFFPSERQRLFVEYAFLWDNIVTPALFTMAGSNISLRASFDGSFFPKAISTILAGVACRVLFAWASSFGQGFAIEQIMFVGVGWVGKAAVQAALGGVALQRAEDENPQDPDRLEHAQNIQTTAMLSAIFFAPLGACAVAVLGRRWLPFKK